MDITKELYGYDLCGDKLYLVSFQHIEKKQIMVSPRINIDYVDECRDYLWRYFIQDNPYVSKIAKRYSEQKKPYSIWQLSSERVCETC